MGAEQEKHNLIFFRETAFARVVWRFLGAARTDGDLSQNRGNAARLEDERVT